MSRADWVPVLLYHQVVEQLPAADPFGNCVLASDFEAQLRWLAARGHRSTTLERVAEALSGGEPVPRRSVVITFDDGYAGNLEVAWPILRRHGFTATVFAVSGSLGGWNEFDGGLGCAPARMLTVEQLRRLHREGAEIGSHSVTHPPALTELDAHALRSELVDSRARLESVLDDAVTVFSYPHSQVDARVEAAVAEAGYRAAAAGVGTAFRPLRLSRVDPASARGMALQARVDWRRLKWLARRVAA